MDPKKLDEILPPTGYMDDDKPLVYKVTPASYSSLAKQTNEQVLAAVQAKSASYDFKAVPLGGWLSQAAPATTIADLVEMGVKAVDVWHGGKFIGRVDLK